MRSRDLIKWFKNEIEKAQQYGREGHAMMLEHTLKKIKFDFELKELENEKSI